MKREFRNYLIAFVFALVPLLFWNCSKIGSPADNRGGSVLNSNVVANDGSGNFVGGPGTTGLVRPLQDVPFTFTPTGDPGPFTIDHAPTWATFNATTGMVSGTVTSTIGNPNFTVRGSKSTFGPYTVYVQGNPLKEFQWHLKNTGQTSFALSGGVIGEDMHMSATVASRITGAGVRVAISDSGIFLGHEALSANVLNGESRNYKNNYSTTHSWLGDPTPNISSPGEAHGTAVASLVLEKGWNDVGGRGMAPDAKFAGFLYTSAQDQLIQNGLYDMATYSQFQGSFDIFNYSWVDPQCALTEYSQTMFDTLYSAVTQQRGGKGSLHLMAAGNNYVDDIANCYSNMASADVLDNLNFSEINSNPYVLNIAAVNADGVSSSYSTPGSALWVSAAGGEYGWDVSQSGYPEASEPAMITADFYGCSSGMKSEDGQYSGFDRGNAPNTSCRYVNTMNGTSSATPVASGAVALMLQVNPNLTWRDVKYILAKTADQVDPSSNPAHHPISTYDLAGYSYDLPWVTNAAGFHFHNYYGFGRINVDKAVQLARNFASPLGAYKEGTWLDSGNLSLSIPDGAAGGLVQTQSVGANYTLEGVQLKVTTDGCAGDLGLELTSPHGTRSILMNINSRIQDGAIQNHTFLSNTFYGETSAGTWTLKVIDGHAGCTAHLTNWKLRMIGY